MRCQRDESPGPLFEELHLCWWNPHGLSVPGFHAPNCWSPFPSSQSPQDCIDEFKVYQRNLISNPEAAALSSCHQLSQGGFAPGLLRGGNFGSSFSPSLIFGFLLQSVALCALGDVFEQHMAHPL